MRAHTHPKTVTHKTRTEAEHKLKQLNLTT